MAELKLAGKAEMSRKLKAAGWRVSGITWRAPWGAKYSGVIAAFNALRLAKHAEKELSRLRADSIGRGLGTSLLPQDPGQSRTPRRRTLAELDEL